MSWTTDKKYRINITVDLQPGVYVFQNESGVGKSYLAKWLNRLYFHNEGVNSISGSVASKIETLNGVVPLNCKLFMLDDYDLYNGKFEAEIDNLRKSAIILVDCKMLPGFNFDWEYCYVSFRDKDVIYVGR